MQLILRDNLPFTTVTVEYQGDVVEVQNVLVDTGSASSIFAADIAASFALLKEAPRKILLNAAPLLPPKQ